MHNVTLVTAYSSSRIYISVLPPLGSFTFLSSTNKTIGYVCSIFKQVEYILSIPDRFLVYIFYSEFIIFVTFRVFIFCDHSLSFLVSYLLPMNFLCSFVTSYQVLLSS